MFVRLRMQSKYQTPNKIKRQLKNSGLLFKYVFVNIFKPALALPRKETA